jgi:hypothetical protein
VVTKPDAAEALGQSGQADGVALKPTLVAVKVTAFLHVAAMGLADSSFTVSAGEYKRQFPNKGFKTATDAVLRACGSRW